MSEIFSAAYFPGCTLKTDARVFENSAMAVCRAAGMPLIELTGWNCCGTSYSLDAVNLMPHLAAVRNLMRAEEEGSRELVTLCAMCYNTLQQAKILIRKDKNREITNDLLNRKIKGTVPVSVSHLLTYWRDNLNPELIKTLVKNPLNSLRVAPYYGCLLLRPGQIAVDDPENPTILSSLITSSGAIAVDFPFKNECCGAFHTSMHKEAVARRVSLIIGSARSEGAEVIAVSCPLCYSNLHSIQNSLCKKTKGLRPVSIKYFTELVAEAMELDYTANTAEPDPRPAGISQ